MPSRNIRRFAFAILLFAAFVSGQEISIVGPSSPVSPGSFEFVKVTGLSQTDLDASVVGVVPDQGIMVMPASKAGVQPIVFALLVSKDATPGKRSFTVSRNAWWKDFEAAVVLAQSGAKAEHAKALLGLAAEWKPQYPIVALSVPVEVGGVPPFVPPVVDPVDPNKPQPPPSPNKPNRLTYVYEKDQGNVPKPVAFALQRLNVDSGGSVVASEFEEDTVNAFGQVPAQYKLALEAARSAGLPALVIQSGNVIIRVVKNPTTEAHVLEAAK